MTTTDPYACRGAHVRYRSPLRPFVTMRTEPLMDLDCTDIGEWNPSKVYAFHGPLQPYIVRQWSLVEVEAAP